MPNTFAIDKLSCQRQETTLFSELSFKLDAGELLLVEGANGSGKSSLLRLLAGLTTPASGDILWQGVSIANCTTEFRQQLHYVGHSTGLRLDLTVSENVAFSDQALLLPLQLHKHTHVQARSLSAGQKRKLALARLLLSKKTLWLLDEPLTALDTKTQLFFLSALEQHLQQGGIAVISSHQPLLLPNATIQVLRLTS